MTNFVEALYPVVNKVGGWVARQFRDRVAHKDDRPIIIKRRAVHCPRNIVDECSKLFFLLTQRCFNVLLCLKRCPQLSIFVL